MDYCDTEWFVLEMNRDHSDIFEFAPKYCISDSFITAPNTCFIYIIEDLKNGINNKADLKNFPDLKNHGLHFSELMKDSHGMRKYKSSRINKHTHTRTPSMC